MSLEIAPETAGSDTPLLTPLDVGKRLNVSRSMAYTLIKRGELKAVYVGRLPRVEASELARYIEARRS